MKDLASIDALIEAQRAVIRRLKSAHDNSTWSSGPRLRELIREEEAYLRDLEQEKQDRAA